MNRISIALLLISLLFLIPDSAEASQVYLNKNETWGGNLTGVFHSSLVFGDIDNDGDVDMVSSGCTSGGLTTCTTAISQVYLNNGSSMVENQTWQQNLTGVGLSSLALGDIDNDGDLDLVLAGDKGGFNGTIKVYTNDGNTFNENSTWESNLTDLSVIGGSVALGDVNNDGRLDLALVGADSSQKNGIYINNGTSFVKDSSWLESLPYVGRGYGLGVVVWGDVDGDNDMDLIFSGSHSTDFYDGVYINNGTSLVKNSTWGQNLGKWGWPSMTLGDYDNDGDLDLAYMGTHSGDVIYVYTNTGQTFEQGQLIGGQFDGSVAFGDNDNDGDLDLITMGRESGTGAVWKNVNSNFQYDSIASLDFRSDDPQQGSLTWIDLDSDLDLDLGCIGKKDDTGPYINEIYVNNVTTANSLPYSVDANFNTTFNLSSGKITISWGNGSDSETPTLGLYYNLRIGTCSGCHDVVSGVYGGSSNPTAGYFGNMMQRKSITLNRPDLENKTIYWAVQTIDTGLAKSEWSEEQVYEIVEASPPCTENWVYGEWSSCVGGQQTRTATDLNSCGTEENKSTTSRSCDDGSSGSSSNGNGGPPIITPPDEEPKRPENVTGYFEKIEPGVDTGISVDEEGLSVRQLWVKVRNEITEVVINIKRLISRPFSVTKEPEGKVYQYINVTHTNLPDSEIEEGKVSFKVERSWIEGNEINKFSIRLTRYYNDEWQKLETALKDEDETYVHYLAETPGFSVFAVTGEPVEKICIPFDLRCEGDNLVECIENGLEWNLEEECEYGCEDGRCKKRPAEPFNYTLIVLPIIVIIIAMAGVYFLKIKKTAASVTQGSSFS